MQKSRSSKRQVIMSDSDDDDREAGLSSDAPAKKKVKTGTIRGSAKTLIASKEDSPFSLDEEESDEYSDGGVDWDEAIKSDIEELKPKKKEGKSEGKGKAKAVPPKRPTIVSSP